MATEYDLTERERIRQALLAYNREHNIGVPRLAKRIKDSHPRHMEIPVRTLSRFLAGMRTHDMALTICAAFVEKLPNRPTAMHALGEALFAAYTKSSDIIIAGTYTVSVQETIISELTITDVDADNINQKFRLVKEETTAAYRRIYDGVVVSTGRAATILLRDRLMGGARIHGLHPTGDEFNGFVYDGEPLEAGGIPYQNTQTVIHRVWPDYDDAEEDPWGQPS